MARYRQRTAQRLVSLSLFAVLFCAQASQASTESTTHVLSLQTLTLPRAIPPLALSETSLWKWSANHWIPVPYQFNEYDDNGNIWIEKVGIAAAGPINTLDDSDRILAIDTGAATTKKHITPKDKIVAALISTSGITYYLRNTHAPEVEKHVNFSRQSGVTRTPLYELSANPDNEIIWRSLKDAQADSNSAPLIDSLELEISAGILTSFSRVSLGPKNLKAEVVGSQGGPLRQTTSYHIKVVMLGIPVMTVDMQMSRYPAAITFSSNAKIPAAYRAIIRKPRVTIGLNSPICQSGTVSLGGTPAHPICPDNNRQISDISMPVAGKSGVLELTKDGMHLSVTLENRGDSPLPIEYYLHPSVSGLQGGYKMSHLPDDNIVQFFMSLDFSRLDSTQNNTH